VSRGWKGLAAGVDLTLRVTGTVDGQYPRFAFEFELGMATNHKWPPAEFLRRDGDTYVNDGCLSPLPPSTLQTGIAELNRLLPLPSEPRHRPSRCSEIRALSCSTLDQSIFEAPGERLAALYEQRQREYEASLERERKERFARYKAWEEKERKERVAALSVRRDSSCAGCAVSRSSGSSIPFGFLLGFLSWRRRWSNACTRSADGTRASSLAWRLSKVARAFSLS
jgi:hypothetical protein